MSTIIYLLCLSIAYLVITSFILLRNRLNFTPLLPADHIPFTRPPPKISICIPARDEERTIERCVQSVLAQQYPGLEIVVLNDRSTDNTRKILAAIKRDHPENLSILQGETKPAGWLGKPWACYQLGKAATGDILIFIDADTWLEKEAVERVVRTMEHDAVDFLTIWPRQILNSFWEKTIIPLIYYALVTLLPVHYVYRTPRWMPRFLKKNFSPCFAAACGQFMAFKKEAYRKTGGHQSVKNKVVEDVALARLIKTSGYKMKMYYGGKTVACRMYNSEREIKEGFRKNFFAGFNYNLFPFILMGFVQLAVYVLPFLTLTIGISLYNLQLIMWSVIPVAIILFHRLLLSFWFGWGPLYGMLQPAGVLWFVRLAFITLNDHFSGREIKWKDRPIS